MGNGKTLFLTYLMQYFHSKKRNLLSNYKLIGLPYTEIKIADDLFDVPKGRNFAGLDELWITADSRSSMSGLNKIFSHSMLQSRHRKIDAAFTVQDWMQMDRRIRNVTSLVFAPHILGYDSKTGKPLAMEVYWTSYIQDYINYERMNCFRIPLKKNGKYVCDMYETREIIDEMVDPRDLLREELIEKYMGYEGKKKDLVSKFVIDHGLSRAEASTIVDYCQRDI